MELRMSCRQQLEELNKASGLEVNQPHGVQVEDLCGMGKGRQREMGLEEPPSPGHNPNCELCIVHCALIKPYVLMSTRVKGLCLQFRITSKNLSI